MVRGSVLVLVTLLAAPGVRLKGKTRVPRVYEVVSAKAPR